jgi:hypothetical protein
MKIEWLFTSYSSTFVSSVFPSVFSSMTCFRRQFLHKMWPIQLVFFLCIVCTKLHSSLLFVTLLHISRDRSNWSSPSFSNIPFQKFPGISDLLFKVSRFQHRKELCSRFGILLDSFLNLSPLWNEKCRILLFECCFAMTILNVISRLQVMYTYQITQ